MKSLLLGRPARVKSRTPSARFAALAPRLGTRLVVLLPTPRRLLVFVLFIIPPVSQFFGELAFWALRRQRLGKLLMTQG